MDLRSLKLLRVALPSHKACQYSQPLSEREEYCRRRQLWSVYAVSNESLGL